MKQKTLTGSNRIFFFLILLHSLFTLMILLFCDIKYEVSDDFVMSLIASGAINGSPSPYIMFSNILYGVFLTLLYTWIPCVNWYFWLQILINFLALIAIAYLISRKFSLALSVLIFCIFYLFSAQDLFLLIQFTKTAAAAICSGSILFLWGTFRSRSRACSICGALLVLAGSLIRFNCIYVAAPFVLLCLAAEANRCKTFLRAYLPRLGACMLLILLVFSLQFINTFAYRLNDETNYFKEYSYVRAKIIDYSRPDYETCRNELEAINISENDYALLESWNFSDPDVFSLDTMKSILAVLNEHRQKNWDLPAILKEIKARRCIHYPGASCCILLGLLNILLNKKHHFAAPVLCAAGVLGLLSYFIAIGRCIYRVEFGCFYGAAAVILLYLEADVSLPAAPFKLQTAVKKSFPALCLLGSAALLFVRVPDYIPDSSYKSMSDREYRNYIDSTFLYDWNYDSDKYTKTISKRTLRNEFLTELQSNPDHLYLLDFSTTIQTLYFDFSPFDAPAPKSFSNAVYLSGVTVNHPSLTQTFRSWGNDNPVLALLSDCTYLVTNTNAERLARFLKEHYDLDVYAHLYKITDDYMIWQFLVSNP